MHMFRRLVLLLIVLLVCPPVLWSKTIPVAAGSSINDCLHQMGSGDTCEVDDGTYPETLDTNSMPNGSASTPTTLKAKNMRKAILRPTGTGPIASFHGKQGLVYDGFVQDGSQMATAGGGLDLNAQNGLNDIVIRNIEIHHIKGDTQGTQGNYLTTAAIGASYTAHNVVMQNLYVHDIGFNQGAGSSCNECYGYGIYLSGNGYTLENSRFEQIAGWVVHGYSSGSPAASDNTIRNNVFKDTGGPVLLCQSNNQIVGNILINVGKRGIGIGQAMGVQLAGACSGQRSADNIVAHNTIVGSDGACIHLGSSSNNAVQNNICYRNGSDAVQGGGGGNTVNHNLLGQDPKFVSATDFHLQPGSPAMNTGIAMPMAWTVVGTAPDIGACEGTNPCGTSGGGSPPEPTGPAAPTGLRVVTQP